MAFDQLCHLLAEKSFSFPGLKVTLAFNLLGCASQMLLNSLHSAQRDKSDIRLPNVFNMATSREPNLWPKNTHSLAYRRLQRCLNTVHGCRQLTKPCVLNHVIWQWIPSHLAPCCWLWPWGWRMHTQVRWGVPGGPSPSSRWWTPGLNPSATAVQQKTRRGEMQICKVLKCVFFPNHR